MLVDNDREDIIQMVEEALGLDKSVRPNWYFDIRDPWEPEDLGKDTLTANHGLMTKRSAAGWLTSNR